LDGKFILVRAISKSMNGIWLEVVVEDPSGENTGIFRLKNYTKPKYSQSLVNNGEIGIRISIAASWKFYCGQELFSNDWNAD
jgi:hypothetical protein